MAFAEIHMDSPKLGVDDDVPGAVCGAEIESFTDNGLYASVTPSEDNCGRCSLSLICEASRAPVSAPNK